MPKIPSHQQKKRPSVTRPGKNGFPLDQKNPSVAVAPGKFERTHSLLPRGTKDHEQIREETRARGESFVAGVHIDIAHLLRGFHLTDNHADATENVEMVTPLMRPYGCGPVAPSNWVVLRTYQRIIEVRDETRMDDTGLAIGDRTFKRCYQLAQLELGSRGRGGGGGGGPSGPSGGLNTGVGFSDERAIAIFNSFRYVSDKLWHRYLFPFGTFLYRNPGTTSKTEANWKKWMLDTPRDTSHVMNPYSVTAADILYLCNTGGYLDRFLYLIGIILWARRNGVNLLHHLRSNRAKPGTCHKQNKLDQFYTLEKHLHVFGSIRLHLWVMESNKQDVGGNWTETMETLHRLNAQLTTEFGVDPNMIESHLKPMTIRSMATQLHGLKHFFSQAARVDEASST